MQAESEDPLLEQTDVLPPHGKIDATPEEESDDDADDDTPGEAPAEGGEEE